MRSGTHWRSLLKTVQFTVDHLVHDHKVRRNVASVANRYSDCQLPSYSTMSYNLRYLGAGRAAGPFGGAEGGAACGGPPGPPARGGP